MTITRQTEHPDRIVCADQSHRKRPSPMYKKLAYNIAALVRDAMVANLSEPITAPSLSKPRPRTVPFYGTSNPDAAEGEEEYYSDEDFDIEEALEQLDAAEEDRESMNSRMCCRNVAE